MSDMLPGTTPDEHPNGAATATAAGGRNAIGNGP